MSTITAFSPTTAAVGGVLIGLAAVVMYAGLGRIAGISGILNGAIDQRSERGWRLTFLLALIAGAGVWFARADAPVHAAMSTTTLVVAGLLVGFGSRLGNGCTSGHGICGLARLSWRSLAAVVVFMSAGFVTVYVLRHLAGAAS